MKTRVKCGICRRTVSQHCLLYSHKCSKEALDARPQLPTVEEKYGESAPTEVAEPAPAEPVPEAEPVEYIPKPKKRVRVQPPLEAPSPPIPEEYEYEAIDYPPPPPLIRQRAATYNDMLLARQLEQKRHRALAQVGPIRRHSGH